MILVPRASLGTEHSVDQVTATFGVLGPIAEGLFLGPVFIQITTFSPVLVAVRFGLGRSNDASVVALEASIGAVPLRAGSARGPGGPFWRFGTAGGNENVSIPWGLRSAGGSSFFVFGVFISAPVDLNVTIVVGMQELMSEPALVTNVRPLGREV